MLNPYAQMVPGNEYILSLAYTGILPELASSWTPDRMKSDLREIIEGFAPFASGKVDLLDVMLGQNTIGLTVRAKAGADIFTLGGLSAAIADTLSQVVFGLTVLPPFAGGGTTTWSEQFEQAGGVTYTPWARVTPQTGPSWIPLALLVAAAGAVLFIVRK